uniref:Uncharacterized protein n=1 Tax=Kalanchoe fedtschenkoi TaxID=63787 RepID=A0A7N0TPH1_KALFE
AGFEAGHLGKGAEGSRARGEGGSLGRGSGWGSGRILGDRNLGSGRNHGRRGGGRNLGRRGSGHILDGGAGHRLGGEGARVCVVAGRFRDWEPANGRGAGGPFDSAAEEGPAVATAGTLGAECSTAPGGRWGSTPFGPSERRANNYFFENGWGTNFRTTRQAAALAEGAAADWRGGHPTARFLKKVAVGEEKTSSSREEEGQIRRGGGAGRGKGLAATATEHGEVTRAASAVTGGNSGGRNQARGEKLEFLSLASFLFY